MSECKFCGASASLLCDGKIWEVHSDPPKRYRVPMGWYNVKAVTCDAPVCRSCAKKVSDIHLKTTKGCRWDSIDLCPDCQKVTDKPVEVVQS